MSTESLKTVIAVMRHSNVDFLKMATRQLKTALVVVVFPHNTVIINKENKWDAE